MCSSIIILLLTCQILRDQLVHNDWSNGTSMLYNGFIHSIWAIALSCIVYLCLTNSGGIIDSIFIFKYLGLVS